MGNKIKYIPVIVTLLAGAITSIIAIKNNYDGLEAMMTILVVLIIFYILGLILKIIAEKNFIIEIEEEPEEKSEEEESEESEENSEQEIESNVDSENWKEEYFE